MTETPSAATTAVTLHDFLNDIGVRPCVHLANRSTMIPHTDTHTI